MLQMMMEDLPPNLDQNPYYFGASHQQNHAPLTLPSYSYASPLESSSSESFSYQQGGNASSSLPNVGYYASQYMNVPKPSVRGFTTSSSRFQPYMTGSSSTFCTPLSTPRNQISLNGQSGSAAGSYHPASLGNGNLVSSNGGSNNSNAFTNGFMHQQMIQETQGYQPMFNSNSNNNCNNSNFVYQSNGNAFYENQDTGYKSTYTTNNGCHPTTYSNQFTDNPSVGGFPQQTLQTNFGSSQNNLIMSYRSNSPDSFHQEGKKKTSPETKKRGTKKRKKKGGNEPTKPVSAYALFFKDTQAAIKAENSSATFGEISKIVASMWDSLSEEAKQVYKQKTEVAKRDYLKQLASFRANMISKGGILDAEEEDLQPLSVLREKMAEQRANSTSPIPSSSSSNNSTASVIDLTESPDEVLPPPPRLRLAPGASHAGLLTSEARVTLRPINVSTGSSVQLNALSQTFTSLPRSASPISMMTKIIVPGQNGAQSTIHVINSMPSSIAQNTSPSPNQTTMAPPTSTTPFRHIILRPLSSTSPIPPTTSGNLVSATPSPPPPIHLRSIVPQSSSPITILPNKPGQIIKVLPSESGGVTFSSVPGSVKGRVIKMVNVVGHPRTTSPTGISFFPQQVPVTVVGPSISQPMSVHQSNVQPILQMLEQESNTHILNNKAQEIQSIKNLSISVAQQENDPNEVDENALMQIPQQNLLQTEDLTSQRSLANNQDPCSSQDTSADNFSHRQCVRDGCINLAISCPYWDNEFCSNECVYSHCRDVFDGWVSARQVSGSVA